MEAHVHKPPKFEKETFLNPIHGGGRREVT
jgi:hypothetical protein